MLAPNKLVQFNEIKQTELTQIDKSGDDEYFSDSVPNYHHGVSVFEDKDEFAFLPHNRAFPSQPVLYLQHSRCCPCCVKSCWRAFEQIRWKLSTCRCLLKHPLKCCKKCKQVTVFDILVVIMFLLLAIVFFCREVAQTVNNEIDGFEIEELSLRTLSLIFGRLSVVSFAISWTLATRNTFWYLLFGIPFERALFYHIWIARFSILLVWAHFVCMLIYWFETDSSSVLDNIFIATNMAGLVALFCVTIIFIFSLNCFRRKHWEFFLKTHWIFFVLFFYWAMKHHYAYFWSDTYWMKIAIGCWLLDVLYRTYISLLRPSFCHEVKLLNLKVFQGEIIKIEVQTKRHYVSCGAGQYFFICIPAVTGTEWHPFSLASNDVTSEWTENLTFYVRAAGDWSIKLNKLANQCDDMIESESLLVKNVYDHLPVFIEGPYGKIAYQIEKYESIVLIAGGIGLTVIANIFDHLMRYLHNNNITTMKRIHFIWVARAPHEDVVKEFNQSHWKYVKCVKDKNGFRESLQINETRVISNYYFNGFDLNNDLHTKRINLFKATYGEGVKCERADIVKIIDEGNDNGLSRCAVFTCGPLGLMEFIESRCADLGIDCHSEVFHF